MEDKLEKLININGVEAVFVFNNKAKTILHLLKRNMDDEVIEEIGKNIIQIFCINSNLDIKEYNNFELIFDKGSLFSFNYDYYTIVIWATKSVQMSLIRLNTSLVISSLQNDKQFKKLVKKNKIDSHYLLRDEYIEKNEELLISQLI